MSPIEIEQMTVEADRPDGLQVCHGSVRSLVIDFSTRTGDLLKQVEVGSSERRAFPIPAHKLQGGYVPIEPFSGQGLERLSSF